MEKIVEWPNGPKIWSRLPKQFRTAFLTGMIVGIVTHLYVFTNMLLNHDSFGTLISTNMKLGFGRWALEFMSSFSTDYQIPLVTGLISIFSLAISAGIVVQFFRVTHPVSAVLIAAMMATYPSVACIFSYMAIADAYFIALLLNVAGAWCVSRYRYGWIYGTVLLTVGMGVYQGYICWAVGLLLFDCILDAMERRPLKEIFTRGVKYLAVIIASFALYLIVLQIFLYVTGQTLSAYKGIAEMGRLPIKTYLLSVLAAVRAFFNFILRAPFLTRGMKIVQLAFFILGGVFFLIALFSRKTYQSAAHTLLVVIGIFLIPVALNLAHIMQGRTESTVSETLTTYSFVLFFAFMIKLTEDGMAQVLLHGHRGGALCSYIPLLLCAVILWNNICIANTAYLSLDVLKEETTALANRIVARIELADGFTSDVDKIAVIGAPDPKYYAPKLSNSRGVQGLSGIQFDIGGIISSYALPRVTSSLTSFSIGQASEEDIAELRQSGVIDAMPCWPDRDAVQIYDGIVVVRFS